MTLCVGQNDKYEVQPRPGILKTSNAMIEMSAGGKLVKIKEERGLLQRLIIISRSRSQLDLNECIGTYEFRVVPRSLFA